MQSTFEPPTVAPPSDVAMVDTNVVGGGGGGGPLVTSALLVSAPEAQTARGERSSYERLRDEVPATECTALDTLTNQSAFVNEADPNAKFESSDFDLYPITRELEVHPCVPEALWKPNVSRDEVTDLWSRCIDGYRRAEQRNYYTDVLRGDLDLLWPVPLFGLKHNALTPVLRLSAMAARRGCPDAKQLTLHFVTMVVLQFYVLARRQFLQACADRNGEFRDSRPPWIFAVFLRYDIKKGAFELDLLRSQLADAKARLLDAARSYDLSSLLRAVLGLLAPSIRRFAPELDLSHEELDTWSMNKVFVTKTQLLVTSHFVPMRVRDYTLNILKSMKQDAAHSANAITQDQLTKHFRLIKHHKMYELKFRGKEPLRNTPEQFDQRKPTTELSFMQSRVPTFFCHFWFSPDSPIVTFDESLQLETTECAYSSILLTLESARRVVDGTLLASVGKHCMRGVERVGPAHREVARRLASELQVRRGQVDLVRLRYAYCIRKYQMVTQLAGHFGASRHAETSPLFVSSAALRWFESQGSGRCPFESGQLSREPAQGYLPLVVWLGTHAWRLPCHYNAQLGIEPGTHDYLAVSHAAAALLLFMQQQQQNVDQRLAVNWYLALRGCVTLLRSEAQAHCLVLRLMRLSCNSPNLSMFEALQAVKRHYMSHRDECQAATEHLVSGDGDGDDEARNSLVLTMRSWRHHSQLDEGDVDASLLFSRRSHLQLALEWFELQGVDEILARPSPGDKCRPGRALLSDLAKWFAGEQSAMRDWPWLTTRCFTPNCDQVWSLAQITDNLRLAALHRSAMVSGHLAMQRPSFHIESSSSSRWRELQAFEADMPQCSELLHRVVEKIRSHEFESELIALSSRLRQSPAFRLSQVGRAALHACAFLLQQVDTHLRHSRLDAKQARLAQLLREVTTSRIDQALPVVDGTKQEALVRAAKQLSWRLQMTQDSTQSAVQHSAEWLAQFYDLNAEAVSQALLKVFTLSSPACRERLLEFQSSCIAAARRQDAAKTDMSLRLELSRQPSPRLMLALGKQLLLAQQPTIETHSATT